MLLPQTPWSLPAAWVLDWTQLHHVASTPTHNPGRYVPLFHVARPVPRPGPLLRARPWHATCDSARQTVLDARSTGCPVRSQNPSPVGHTPNPRMRHFPAGIAKVPCSPWSARAGTWQYPVFSIVSIRVQPAYTTPAAQASGPGPCSPVLNRELAGLAFPPFRRCPCRSCPL